MKLTETPEIINWPVSHYVYVEKIGPFMENAPSAWQELHKNLADLSKSNVVSGFISLYKMKPQMIYRAGVVVGQKPENLPPGFQYIEFLGGKYAKFTLTGPYAQLPEASSKVFTMVEKTALPLRDDFYIENYVNDPRVIPESELITEILIPTR